MQQQLVPLAKNEIYPNTFPQHSSSLYLSYHLICHTLDHIHPVPTYESDHVVSPALHRCDTTIANPSLQTIPNQPNLVFIPISASQLRDHWQVQKKKIPQLGKLISWKKFIWKTKVALLHAWVNPAQISMTQKIAQWASIFDHPMLFPTPARWNGYFTQHFYVVHPHIPQEYQHTSMVNCPWHARLCLLHEHTHMPTPLPPLPLFAWPWKKHSTNIHHISYAFLLFPHPLGMGVPLHEG